MCSICSSQHAACSTVDSEPIVSLAPLASHFVSSFAFFAGLPLVWAAVLLSACSTALDLSCAPRPTPLASYYPSACDNSFSVFPIVSGALLGFRLAFFALANDHYSAFESPAFSVDISPCTICSATLSFQVFSIFLLLFPASNIFLVISFFCHSTSQYASH